MIEIGDMVKVKSYKKLRELIGPMDRPTKTMNSGLDFHSFMFAAADKEFIITKIAKPSKGNKLKEASYKIGTADVYLTSDMFDKIKED